MKPILTASSQLPWQNSDALADFKDWTKSSDTCTGAVEREDAIVHSVDWSPSNEVSWELAQFVWSTLLLKDRIFVSLANSERLNIYQR